MTAPQPSVNALLMTFKFVPGGPEPMMNGFGNLSPSTLVANVGITCFPVNPVSFLTRLGRDCHNNFTFKAIKLISCRMSEENIKTKRNLLRRGIGLFFGLLPLILLMVSIAYGFIHNSRPKFAAIGWMIGAAVIASLNFYLSFTRPRIYFQ